MTRTLVWVFALSTAGCFTHSARVGSQIYVPADAATTCAMHCQNIGLRLESVVIMASTVGCVCSASSAAPGAGGATAAGMATLLMQQQASSSWSHSPPRTRSSR